MARRGVGTGYIHMGMRARGELSDMLAGRRKAQRLLERLESDEYIQGLLEMANIVVVGRLGYNDHGLTHSRIVARNSVQILRLLRDGGVEPNIVRERTGSYEDAEAVVLAAAYLHDLGNAVHRDVHYLHTLVLCEDFLDSALGELYGNERRRLARLKAATLEAIYTHDEEVDAISVEGGSVKVGDGTDMACGRARVPFQRGKKDIHSISAMAINGVRITRGEEKPVRIEVEMSCSAGVFQIQNVLGGKIRTSGIKQHLEVVGIVNARDKDQIFERIEL
ncbi:MAG: HD domain-containing protein [Thermoplasmatota archaeon]